MAELFDIQPGVNAPDMNTQRDGSLSICVPKTAVLRRETRAVFENQLASSHRFAEYLKYCRVKSSERLLRTPVDEKTDESRKLTREGADSVERRRAEDSVMPLS